jgi:hypothetical protein
LSLRGGLDDEPNPHAADEVLVKESVGLYIVGGGLNSFYFLNERSSLYADPIFALGEFLRATVGFGSY